MTSRILPTLVFIAAIGCGGSSNDAKGTADGGSSGSRGDAGSGGATPPGMTADGGALPTDPGTLPAPPETCPAPSTASDISHPDLTLGAAGGPPCTEAGLQTALDHGGVITFQCGGTTAAPFVLTLSTEHAILEDIVLDGEGKVTLSGNKVTRILKLGNGDFTKLTPNVVVQHLNFVDGHTTDVAGTSSTDHGGAAIYRLGAALTVIDCKFLNNIGPSDGQDVAGGAIYSIGGGNTTIVGSTFSGNTCSNGGALGNLGIGDLTIVNSTFEDNTATGKNANPGDGGNGGAITVDGPASTGSCNGGTATGPFTPKTVSICGTVFHHNVAGISALGGAFFRTVDTTCVPKNTAPVIIDKSTFDSNDSDSAGALYVHQVDMTMTNTTLSNNASRAGNCGAFWAEGSAGADVTLNLTNVTVSGNKTLDGLGGGFFIGGNVGGGEFLHVTVAANSVATSSGNEYAVFGAGLVGDVSKVKLTNSIFANNQKPAAVSGDSSNCESAFIDGGGNIEFTAAHPDPKRCVAGSTLVDPLLATLADNGGPTQTIAVATGSPAVGKATTSCTATDQRGMPRKTPCASGAFEPQ